MAEEIYKLDGKKFIVEENPGGDAALPPGSIFEFEGDAEEVSATYSGGRIIKGELKGHIVDNTLQHRYTQVLDDKRRTSGRASLTIRRLDDGRLELTDDWAWKEQNGDGLCRLIEQKNA